MVCLMLYTWLVLGKTRNYNGCEGRNARKMLKEEVTCRKKKKPFLEIQVQPHLFAPSPSLPAPLSLTHTHCTLGKLQSFAQIKSSYSYWQYYIELVTGSYWGQALWEKGQQDSRVFFSFTTKQSIGSQNLFIIILNSCLNSSSFSSRNFGPCTNID